MEKSRNLGIDLLRIILMVMIVAQHTLSKTGILNNCEIFSANYGIAFLLLSFSRCAINCYAMISGYVYVNAKFKLSNIINLWMQVFFYSVGITLLFSLISLFVPTVTVGKLQIIQSFFPVIFTHYWYFSQYFCMFFFIPYLNHLLNTLKPEQIRRLIFTIILLFSIIPTLRHADIFHAADGYSALWLASLYMVGGYIKKYPDHLHWFKKHSVKLYIACVLAAYASKWGIQFITFKLLGAPNSGTIFLLYTSPIMLLAAICLLLFFSDLKIQYLKKCITFLSPLTFGVYLIHEHNFIRQYIMSDLLTSYANINPFIMLCIIIAVILIVYIASSFIELLRVYLFRFLKIAKLSQWFETRLKTITLPRFLSHILQ